MTKIKCPHCGKIIDMDQVRPIEESNATTTKPVKKLAAKKPKAKKTSVKKPVAKKPTSKKPVKKAKKTKKASSKK